MNIIHFDVHVAALLALVLDMNNLGSKMVSHRQVTFRSGTYTGQVPCRL